MRDLVLISILSLGVLAALRYPWIGAMQWTWVSLMSPHMSLAWSLQSAPVGLTTALATLVGLLFTKDKHNPFVGLSMVLLASFVIWTCVTLPFSIYFEKSLPLFERSIKIFFMLFVTAALIDTKKKLDVFVWVCVLSIGYYGFKGGLFTIAKGGNHRVWGPGGFIEGNNEVALAIITIIPLIRYLQMQQNRVWARHAMTMWMLLCAAAAIGSYSRGAFLGIGVMTVFLWLKGDRKIQWGISILVVLTFLLPLMPDQWWDRMSTIKSYQADDSSLGRINAWWMAFNLANDRLFGGGYMVSEAPIFRLYAPDPERVHAAHSIYFQVLGEHGWIGLTLFVVTALTAWYSAKQTIRLAESLPDGGKGLQWAVDLSRMCQVSLVGFAAGGSFLSLAYFDLPYNIILMIALANFFCRRIVAQSTSDHIMKIAATRRLST